MDRTNHSSRRGYAASLPLRDATCAALLRVLVEDRGAALWPLVRSDPALAVHFLHWAAETFNTPWQQTRPSELLESLTGEALANWIADACRAWGPTNAIGGDRRWPASPPCPTEAIIRFCASVGVLAEEQSGQTATRRASVGGALNQFPGWTYLLGLVSRVGMLALAGQEQSYAATLRASASLSELCHVETQRYSTDHLTISGGVARGWKFPEPFRRAIDELHETSTLDDQSSPSATCGQLQRAAELAWKKHAPEWAKQKHFEGNPDQAAPDHECEQRPAVSAELTSALAECVAQRHRLRARLHDEKLSSLAEFAAAASHEFNNPLSVIYGRAQLLLAGEEQPERRRALLTMATQATRIHEMLADLMLFARPPAPHPEPLSLADTVNDVVARLQPAAAAQSTALAVDCATRTDVIADPVQMQVLVEALIRNALEAVGHGGSIEVTLARTTVGCSSLACIAPRSGALEPAAPPAAAHQRNGSDGGARTEATTAHVNPTSQPTDQILLTVTDDGPGLSETDRGHLFDPLYSGREAGRGMGLGLSKCWQIVQNHRGSIDVHPSPTAGTRIIIHLPAAPAPLHQPSAAPSKATSGT